MLSIDFIANPAPRRALELVSEAFAAVAREVELAARRLPPGLEAALQTFFNERTERGALLLGDTPGLLNQSVGELYGGLHKVLPYQRYGYTLLLPLVSGKVRHSRSVPDDKYRIVDTLQKGGHIVVMTGDGVNDAPALKKADCGFAVANAADAARAAADIVLTAQGLSVINEAIQEARITFERMKSYATFRIAETVRIVLFMTLSIVVFNFYPITALMIILLALLNDIPILAIAYDNTRVDRRPVRWKMSELLTVSCVLGVAGVISSFLLYYFLREKGFSEDMIRTMLILKLIIAGHSTLYVTRTAGWFWQRPYPSWLLMGATFGTEILGTIFAVYGIFVTPIGWEYALWMWLYALTWFVINDAVKAATYKLLLERESVA